MNKESSSDSESVYCGEAKSVNGVKSEWYEDIIIEDSKVKCKLNTGANVSIIPVNLLNKINENLNLKLLPTNIKLESFEGNQVKPVGMINLQCQYKDTKCFENFIIVDCKSMLLGLPGCVNLNLVKRVHSVPISVADTSKENFIKENIEVFKGTGKVPDVFHIPTRCSVDPIYHPSPRIPLFLLEPLKIELERLNLRD